MRGWTHQLVLAQASTVEEDGGGTFLLGEDLLPLLVLAIGGAMAVGTLLALVRPRADGADDDPEVVDDARANDLERPPLVRSLLFMAIGLVGVVWATATLLV